MDDFKFSLPQNRLNALFPFYILIDENLIIKGFGSSLGKLIPQISAADSFNLHFTIKKPLGIYPSYNTILDLAEQSVLLESITGIMFRGQWEKLPGALFFAGSPAISSAGQATKLGLTPNHFAAHDAHPDLLHILKGHEINSEKLRELLSDKQPGENAVPEIKLAQGKRSTNNEGVVFMHPNGKIFWCNDAYLAISGYTRDDLINKTPEEMRKIAPIDKEDMDKVLAYFSKGEPFDISLRRRRKNGSTFWTRTKGQPIFNEDGILTQYLTIIEDLTPQREKEERLSLLSLIAEKNINPVIVCDSEGKIEWVSSNFVKTTGYTKEEAIGQRPGELLEGPETDPQTSLYIKTQASKGLPVSAEILNYTKDGRKHWIKLHGQALYGKEGEVLKYYAIREDITDRKLMEAQREELLRDLARSNRELEDYAQIVSHDLKSPLHSIHSLISWIKEDSNGTLNHQSLQYFGIVEDKLQMMHDLIEGVLTYSKIGREDITKETVDVHEVVTDTIAMMHVPVHIKVTVQNRLPVMRADRFRLQQLFQNLIANAIASIDKPSGFITISAEEQQNYFVFCIKDNGAGLTREQQEKLFAKFSSFAPNNKPGGMGLSIIQKIVENYKGKIWVAGQPGTGTSFYIKLYK